MFFRVGVVVTTISEMLKNKYFDELSEMSGLAAWILCLLLWLVFKKKEGAIQHHPFRVPHQRRQAMEQVTVRERRCSPTLLNKKYANTVQPVQQPVPMRHPRLREVCMMSINDCQPKLKGTLAYVAPQALKHRNRASGVEMTAAPLYALVHHGTKRQRLCVEGDSWKDIESAPVLTTTTTIKRRMVGDGNVNHPKRPRVDEDAGVLATLAHCDDVDLYSFGPAFKSPLHPSTTALGDGGAVGGCGLVEPAASYALRQQVKYRWLVPMCHPRLEQVYMMSHYDCPQKLKGDPPAVVPQAFKHRNRMSLVQSFVPTISAGKMVPISCSRDGPKASPSTRVMQSAVVCDCSDVDVECQVCITVPAKSQVHPITTVRALGEEATAGDGGFGEPAAFQEKGTASGQRHHRAATMAPRLRRSTRLAKLYPRRSARLAVKARVNYRV